MVPSNGSKSSSSNSSSHAVSRSSELLSCCKTAWKIQQQQEQQQQQLQDQQPAVPRPQPTFRLADTNEPPTPALAVLEEGLTLLRAMEYGLKQLQLLVRRRGHTNDPTQEIATLVQQLEQDTQELTEFCQQVLQTRRRSKQAKRHWELVVQWFQQMTNHYSSQLQSCLKVRGDVLTEQAQQRKKLLVDPKAKSKSNGMAGARRPTAGASSRHTATPLFDSPLFTAPSNGSGPAAGSNRPSGTTNGYYPNGGNTQYNGYASATSSSTGTSSYYGGGGGYGGAAAGYGGGGYGNGVPSSSVVGGTGMRQRKGETVAFTTTTQMDYTLQQQEEETKVHQQIQLRKQQRETQQRLNDAQQAETMLGELGQLFGKMSSLISQQGEVLEKIEDDVEAAHADIIAAQEELTTLYGLKKGNRPLIIKVFLILNFLIIFMRAYKK